MADDKFTVDVPGYDEQKMSMLELRALAVQKIISPQTMVTVAGSGKKYPAASDRKSTRLNSSHSQQSRMPSSA